MKKTSILALLMIVCGFMAKAQIVTTPTEVSNCTDSLTVVYHPLRDTNASPAGDAIFKTDTAIDIYVYTWARSAWSSTTYQLYAWGDVGAAPGQIAAKSYVNDSLTYTWTLPNFRNAFIAGNQPFPAAQQIDTIFVIFRTQSGDSQTVNLSVAIDSCGSLSVAHVANNITNVSVYPNPATNNVNISYAFAEAAKTSIRVENLIGQVVMTQELGEAKSGNAELSLANIPAGVYFVTVSNGTSKTVKQLIKN